MSISEAMKLNDMRLEALRYMGWLETRDGSHITIRNSKTGKVWLLESEQEAFDLYFEYNIQTAYEMARTIWISDFSFQTSLAAIWTMQESEVYSIILDHFETKEKRETGTLSAWATVLMGGRQ